MLHAMGVQDEIAELVEREGITRRAAWYRILRATGKRIGFPRGPVGELAAREGISRQAAWYRLRRATGKPVGRPPKTAKKKRARKPKK
jgi:hypothetical protein